METASEPGVEEIAPESKAKTRIAGNKRTSKSFTDFNKQIGYHKNRLKADPKNAELYYDLSSIYLILKKYKNAHYFIANAIKYAKTYAEQEKYNVFRGKVERDYYKYAKRKNDIYEYGFFLKKFPDSFYKNEVREQLEVLKYKRAVEQDSVELFEEFLIEYPNTLHLRAITYHLDELKWEAALRINTIKNYQRFLIDNPLTDFREPTLEKIDRLRYEGVQVIDTAEAYGGFIQKYPANKYINTAKIRIKELQFVKVEKSDSVKEYEEYIKDNPEGIFVDVSLDKIDELRYKEVKESDSIEALEDFVKNALNSRYLYKAERLLDVMRFEVAEKEDTIEAYGRFIEKFPNSPFRHDAKDRAGQLKKQALIKELCDDGQVEAEKGNIDKAIEIYTEALNVDYSSRAHFAVGKLYEKIADIKEDYAAKIEYLYKAIASFKVVLRRDPNYKGVSFVFDNLLAKRSREQQIMTDARLRNQKLEEPIRARVITYSKSPVLVFGNIGDKYPVIVQVENIDSKERIDLNVMPQSEAKKTFMTGKTRLDVVGSRIDAEFLLELFPYYEYIVRVE